MMWKKPVNNQDQDHQKEKDRKKKIQEKSVTICEKSI